MIRVLLLVLAIIIAFLSGYLARSIADDAIGFKPIHYLLLSEDSANHKDWHTAIFNATKAASFVEEGYLGFDYLGSMYICLSETDAALVNFAIAHNLYVSERGGDRSLYLMKFNDLDSLGVEAYKQKYSLDC